MCPVQNAKESTRLMSDINLHYRRKYLWHIVALRFAILSPPWILRFVLDNIAECLYDLCSFLTDKLPNPYILEKLSDEEKCNPHKVQN